MPAIPRYLLALLASYAAGLFGLFFVNAASLSWYGNLHKPLASPPDSLFLPVWLVLYALMGIALASVWGKMPKWNAWSGLFVVSLAFNAAWTMFFFGFHTIFIALVDVGFLALLVLILMLTAWEIDAMASLLLLPYLLWVVFAVYLNAGVWLLN